MHPTLPLRPHSGAPPPVGARPPPPHGDYPPGATLAPRITSHPANGTVHARVLLVSGTCGAANGHLWVTAHHYTFPPQTFPVAHGRFKALVHLSPGENVIQLTFSETATGQNHSSTFVTTYVPLLQNPPLHLAILVGCDSPETFDDVPGAAEPNNLETAKKRLRMAGYLWAAYTEAEMARHGLGHRTFRLDERWEPDTLSRVDTPYRQTAHIHVLRSKYTTAHIRDPGRAQQGGGEGKGDLYGVAMEAVREAFPGPKNTIALLTLDATGRSGQIVGHAALGGGTDQHHLGIFGSHCLFSWPSNIEAVVPCFTDPRPVDRKHCGVDAEGDRYWMAANVGLGAMLHELGHALGCPHERDGVMLRDYVRLNRSFAAIEPTSTDLRTAPECAWHRLDALRFRCHAAFTLPSDDNIKGEINALGVDGGIEVSAAAGILFITFKFRDSGEEFPKTWLEWPGPSADAPRSYIITPQYLAENIHADPTRIELAAWSRTGAHAEFTDIAGMLRPERDPDLGWVYRTRKFGGQPAQPMSAHVPRVVATVRVWCGFALDGVEFLPPGQAQGTIFGKRGGSPKEFPLLQTEAFVGLGIRSGAWVDAVQVVTSSGRRSPWFGGESGGAGEAVVPRGYRIVALWGEVGDWVNSMGLSYCRI